MAVNYYSKDLISNLIASLAEGVASSYQLLIVNNSPEEASIHDLASNCITIIESGENLGFGRACNLGIQYAWQQSPQSLVWLINPDATLDAQADEFVQSCFSTHQSLAILGTQIRNTTGEIWFSAGEFNRWTGYINHRIAQPDDESNTNSLSSTAWVSGCSLILNLARFRECPSFDPAYFLYFEDADLCERYTRQGYHLAITSKALVTHQVSAIIGKNVRFMFEHYTFGRLLFLWRYATFPGFSLYFLYLVLKILRLLPQHPDNARGRWQGMTRFLTRRSLSSDPIGQP
ncbi:MAG: glycosyltransferase family 2 protein [Leptolyngbyaceae cyanobacterium SM2_5_2]|nr:glycosyltransferase family 2 protein [Leptolyngbyaceae cyanobacterium SM2_5_2]